jgi:iron complex transport system ATP-binding protein
MILSVLDVHFAYNSVSVLSQVRFDLMQGEILAVLGTNGAGKSTLLKCLNGILRPRLGSILLGNQELRSMSLEAIARGIGYVPQKSTDTRLTVFEAVLLGRKPHMGWSMKREDYALVEKILLEIGLEPLAHRPVSDLSGGEAQKVIIARALTQAPKVLLLDEPTSNLDLKNQLDVMTLIRNVVKRENLAAVISIHDLNLALRFADKLLLLKDHQVHSLVSREELTPPAIRDVYGVEARLITVGCHRIVVPA